MKPLVLLQAAAICAAFSCAAAAQTKALEGAPNTEPVVSSPTPGGWTTIPLPAFVYNRNEGAWYGGLAPMFRANAQGEVEDIVAPLYLHNDKIEETFTLNCFGYRRHTVQYHLILSHATRIERLVDLYYRDSGAGEGGRYIVAFAANAGKSAFNRFFGFGNTSREANESIYTLGEANVKAAVGLNLGLHSSITLNERYRGVNIEEGVTSDLPQAVVKYATVPGMNDANIVGHGLMLSYDSRDNQLTPLSGTNASIAAEFDQNVRYRQLNRWGRVSAEARNFLPNGDRFVLVTHGLIDTVVGEDKGVPFYERPTLGGETTLRGFGRGRFVQDSAVLLNIEQRATLTSQVLMGNLIEFEAAPFLDVGRVMRSFNRKGFLKDWQVNPGMGLRVLARPNIAARLDVGYGKDGAAVYVGLDYPF